MHSLIRIAPLAPAGLALSLMGRATVELEPMNAGE